jgi:hypothetical protein
MLAIGQLAYYRAVSVPRSPKKVPLYRAVVFNRSINDAGALRALEYEGIEVLWMDQGEPRFANSKFSEVVAKPR